MSSRLGPVLVTGGAGFIGCALSQVLADEAERWVVLRQPAPAGAPRGRAPGRAARGRRARRRRRHQRRRPRRACWPTCAPTSCVHLAAETGTAQSLTESTRHGLVNVVGTTQLLDALTRTGHVPEPLRADQQPRRLRRGRVAATPTARLCQPGPAHPRPARGRPSGTHGDATPTCPTPSRSTHPDADQRLRRHQAGPGAHPHRVDRLARHARCRCSGCRTSTAPASRSPTPTPASCRSSPSWPARASRSRSTRTARSPATSSSSTTWSSALVAALVRNRPDRQRLVDVGSGERTTIRHLAERDRRLPRRPRTARHRPVPRRRRPRGVQRARRGARRAGLDAAVAAGPGDRGPAGLDRRGARRTLSQSAGTSATNHPHGSFTQTGRSPRGAARGDHRHGRGPPRRRAHRPRDLTGAGGRLPGHRPDPHPGQGVGGRAVRHRGQADPGRQRAGRDPAAGRAGGHPRAPQPALGAACWSC